MNDDEKADAMTVMLKGDALSFYNRNFVIGESYSNISQKLWTLL